MKQGDIITVNFPFTSLKGSKIRPALIISNGKKFNTEKNRRIKSRRHKENKQTTGKLLKLISLASLPCLFSPK